MADTIIFNVPTVLMPSLAAAQPAPGAFHWRTVTVATLREAEQHLDEAEADGFEKRELIVQTSGAFVVRWR